MSPLGIATEGKLLMAHFRKRPTIGFLTANIHIGAGRTLWPGIVDAARQQDVNLICFPGGGLQVQEGFEAQRNVIYDLVDSERIDGLVSWSSTVGGALDASQVAAFHRRYHPRPIVSLAQLMEGIPTLLVDSYQGMRAAIVHLIKVHGYHRVAFVRGPESHYYAQERYRAYTDVLQEKAIPFDPNLVTRPIHWEAGAEAIRMLIDENNLRPHTDFQAVAAVSDLLALDVLKTLQARGIQVPSDVAVVGFNDSIEGRLIRPPLTSVSLPFYEQGAQAVEALVARIAGQPVPTQVVLQSRLVVRQSCGCPSQLVVQAAVGTVQASSETFDSFFSASRDRLVVEMTQAVGASDQVGEWAGQLLDAFRFDVTESPSRFVPTLESILRRMVMIGGDVSMWHGAISILRRAGLPYLEGQTRLRAEDLFGQSRVIVGETAQRLQAYQQWQAERQSETLREIGQALITTFEVDKLGDVMAERLPKLGITSCYLSLYENSASSLEQARLVLAYTEQGRIALEPGGRRFLSRQLVPEGLLPQRRYSLVVEPLYFRAEQIGFALFEIGPRDGGVYEVLRGYISSALKGALLFRGAHAALTAAEKADQIKTRLLANVSHELRTPLNIILGYTNDALRSREFSDALDISGEWDYLCSPYEGELLKWGGTCKINAGDSLDFDNWIINGTREWTVETLNPTKNDLNQTFPWRTH